MPHFSAYYRGFSSPNSPLTEANGVTEMNEVRRSVLWYTTPKEAAFKPQTFGKLRIV